MKKFNIKVNGIAYEVEVEEVGGASAAHASAPVRPAAPTPVVAPPSPVAAPAPAAAPAAPLAAGEAAITAPMPGKILKINVEVGAAVKAGDVVLILEAMKMQNEIQAATDGTVKAINTTVGANVAVGESLVVIG